MSRYVVMLQLSLCKAKESLDDIFYFHLKITPDLFVSVKKKLSK